MRSLQMFSDFDGGYDNRNPSMVSRKYCCATGLAISVLGVICGVLLGHFAMRDTREDRSDVEAHASDLPLMAESVEQKVMTLLDTYDYEGMLRKLVSMPKLGGTPGDKTSAEFVRDLWKDQGLQDVHLTSYSVYLSIPDPARHSKVSVLNMEGQEVVSIVRKKQGSIEPYLAYSASTADSPVVGEPVYANYGHTADFKHLEETGISVRGKIVIMRFGSVFRGNKVRQAESRGASAVILYPDPADYAINPLRPFPESMSLPRTAVSSGTLALLNGDPLTPIYPATDDAYRIPVENAALPKIAVFTASYDETAQILRRMKGPPASADWTGELNISEYRLGPGFVNNETMKLEVYLKNGIVPTYNVIGKIAGKEEPGKLVIVGNHRDAWSPGAFDPVSGTVALMALTEAYGKLAIQGWKPRRTLMFCSWGSEEFGLIGSQEWVEEHRMQLSHQAVAYLNTDISVQGNGTLEVASSPLLAQLIWDSTKLVPNPNPLEVQRGKSTVFQTWLSQSPSLNNPETEPRLLDLPSDSDYAPFFHELGIPSVDVRYTCSNLSFDSCLPVYHTDHETEEAYKLVDKEFKFLKATTQVLALATHGLVVQPLLPMTLKPYAAALNQSLSELRSLYGTYLEEQNINISSVVSAVEDFSKTVDAIDTGTNQKSAHEIEYLNNKLQLLERTFIDSPGILAGNLFRNQSKHISKHVIFGVNMEDVNVGSRFTVLKQALTNASFVAEPLVSSLAYHIRSATFVLNDSW